MREIKRSDAMGKMVVVVVVAVVVFWARNAIATWMT